MKWVEDIAAAEDGARGGDDGDGVLGEGGGERDAPGEVFLCGYTWGQLAGAQEVRVRFVDGLPEGVGRCGDGVGAVDAEGSRTRERSGFEGQASLSPWDRCFSPSW